MKGFYARLHSHQDGHLPSSDRSIEGPERMAFGIAFTTLVGLAGSLAGRARPVIRLNPGWTRRRSFFRLCWRFNRLRPRRSAARSSGPSWRSSPTAVLWATFGWIDIVATAQGKIIPSGYSKVIQPYEAGVIAAIHVQNGQLVKQGEVLIELDPTLNRADHDRASNEYRAAKVEAARLRALIAGEPNLRGPS